MARTRRKKKRTHQVEGTDSSKKSDPKTFVFRRGKHWGALGDLESDLRRMMLPHTAAALKESKRNTLKDFVAVAGPLGGPTLTLRIRSHSLMSDVAASQARPRVPPNAFKTPPLVVLNNFSSQQKQLALAASLFQGMFPSINVHTVNLATCQRVVLLSVDSATGYINLRHFTISTAPSGVKRSLKALIGRQDVPDLGGLQDISEFITKSGYGSESEGEDAETSRVVLSAPAAGRAGKALVGRQSRVRLHEVGPRLELEIVKVEEGLCAGAVLYHAHVTKTKAQASAQQAVKDEADRLRAQRRRQQEENVRRKEEVGQEPDAEDMIGFSKGKGSGFRGKGRPQGRRHGGRMDDDDEYGGGGGGGGGGGDRATSAAAADAGRSAAGGNGDGAAGSRGGRHRGAKRPMPTGRAMAASRVSKKIRKH
eukprot:gene13842-13963_t